MKHRCCPAPSVTSYEDRAAAVAEIDFLELAATPSSWTTGVLAASFVENLSIDHDINRPERSTTPISVQVDVRIRAVA